MCACAFKSLLYALYTTDAVGAGCATSFALLIVFFYFLYPCVWPRDGDVDGARANAKNYDHVLIFGSHIGVKEGGS